VSVDLDRQPALDRFNRNKHLSLFMFHQHSFQFV
jgi:hypothetical protein